MANRPLKIVTEPIYDPYGGLYWHTASIKKYSSHKIREVSSMFTRILLNRSKSLKQEYKKYLINRGLKGYDIVHSRSDPWFIDLCRVSTSDRCKWVHTYHALFHEEDYMEGLQEWHKEQNRALIEVASKADIKISVSKWGHDYLLEKYSIETVIIENGADLEVCDKARPERFRKKHGLEDFVLFVGSIREVKNPVLFIELATRMPDIRFVMIGPGLNETDLPEKYGISIPGNVILMGKMGHMDVLDAMSACQAYVMTSKHEGLPNTLLEAMAMSKPVVVPSHSGCRELVPSGEYGFLYDLGSIDELVEQAKQALASEHVGERARERIEQKYSWKILARKLDLLYESCR